MRHFLLQIQTRKKKLIKTSQATRNVIIFLRANINLYTLNHEKCHKEVGTFFADNDIPTYIVGDNDGKHFDAFCSGCNSVTTCFQFDPYLNTSSYSNPDQAL